MFVNLLLLVSIDVSVFKEAVQNHLGELYFCVDCCFASREATSESITHRNPLTKDIMGG